MTKRLTDEPVDVTVVGAGILGLAHAWMAARRGLRVAVVERSAEANGASVRNFGMIWPIGQVAGDDYATALRSRELWLEISQLAGLPIENCGSVHVAHHRDEMATLDEFCGLGTHQTELLTAKQVIDRAPLVQANDLLGGMFSPTELRVNPRNAARTLASYFGSLKNVRLSFSRTVIELDQHTVRCSDGSSWKSDRVIICSGSDLQTLYPDEFQHCELRVCKLQMLSASWSAKPVPMPHIASGLTLRHYRSFESCPSLVRLRERIAERSPELNQFGIHVMASAFGDGQLILGDSHEYGQEITPFDKEEINELMLRELRKVIQLEDWTVKQRWHGIYAKHPSKLVVERQLPSQHIIFVAPGGAGMTLSFGLAESAWKRWLGD